MKKGSTLAFSLLYIALLLILIVGISYLISRAFKTQQYITQGMQASYNAESALELALYNAKLHREGYEQHRYFPTSTIGFGKSDQGALDYEVIFTNPAHEEQAIPLTNTDRQVALFYETDALSAFQNNSDLSLDFRTKDLPISIQNTTKCIELKLSGKQGSTFETIGTTLPCSQDLQNIDNHLFSDGAQTNKGLITHATDFIKTHTEIYLVARLLPNLTEDKKPSLLIKTSSKTSSYNKKVTATGRYNNLEIMKEMIIPQDQSPDILSMAIWHK